MCDAALETKQEGSRNEGALEPVVANRTIVPDLQRPRQFFTPGCGDAFLSVSLLNPIWWKPRILFLSALERPRFVSAQINKTLFLRRHLGSIMRVARQHFLD